MSQPARLLGARYRLDELLASGGMAQVWLGTDEVLRRAIAVKVLHQHLAADETFVTRFRHEAIAVARLSHPAIVNVYDTCSDDGIEAIVMELVRGQTLRERLDEGPLDPWVAANIAAQVAGALAVAHAAGLVHRDIKPANILLSEDGRVKVGDFGIAKAAESADLTQEGSFLGTAKYLAPEQVEAKPVDARTDLYSLGVVLYEMLCGRVPFEADTSSGTALARLHSDPQRPRLVKAGVPCELEAITMRLLAPTPPTATPRPPTPVPPYWAPGPTTAPPTATRRSPSGCRARHVPPPPRRARPRGAALGMGARPPGGAALRLRRERAPLAGAHAAGRAGGRGPGRRRPAARGSGRRAVRRRGRPHRHHGRGHRSPAATTWPPSPAASTSTPRAATASTRRRARLGPTTTTRPPRGPASGTTHPTGAAWARTASA